MNVNKTTCAPTDKNSSWETIDWNTCRKEVKRLQMRIVKAQKEGRYGKVKALQWTLTHSFYAKALSVKRVTENSGKRTSGVDHELWLTPKSRFDAIDKLRQRGYSPKPLKRVYIPKGNSGKMRPLGIPTMTDRAMQALYKLALEPVAETMADGNSYGFRPKRSLHDAIEACFKVLSTKKSATWVLEGDIKGCFDNIGYDWLIQNIPMDKTILHKWLTSGLIEKNRLFPTRDGTPQGGVISPTLANMALDGLENILREKFPKTQRKPYAPKVNYVRYADDFIITGATRELLEDEVMPVVKAFMAERGLTLSAEKTKITHVSEGLDFLGKTLRRYDDGKFYIKPSKKNIMAFMDKIRDIIKSNRSIQQEKLIRKLNPIIKGWAENHKHVVSSKIFAWVNHQIWKAVWQWAKRRHPRKRDTWVFNRYFHTLKGRKWCFAVKTSEIMSDGEPFMLTLFNPEDVIIVRHTKIKAAANPYDAEWTEYFEERESRNMVQSLKGKKFLLNLWKKQNRRCRMCNSPITTETEWIIHEGSLNGKIERTMLHKDCHKALHKTDFQFEPVLFNENF